MADQLTCTKPLSTSPLKVSAPLGAALAFMGMDGSLPLFHGSQGCTAFALVMMVRHFREAIPLQTTAMNQVSTILGGMDHVEDALCTVVRRARPKIIGLISTALTETRGEDMAGDLKIILARNPELAATTVVNVAAPDFAGSLETGWSKAVTAMIEAIVEVRPCGGFRRRVNLLPGAHMMPGDLEALKELVAEFDLAPVVLPDLSGSLDGHVPDHFIPTTFGGTSLAAVRDMGRARLTIAIGEHMRPAAEALRARTGVPALVLDRATGLAAADRLVVALSRTAARPVPEKIRRQRSQLVDAMLDGHFYFAGRSFAVAGEPAVVAAYGNLVSEMGGSLAAAVTTGSCRALADLPIDRVIVGDFEDVEERIADAGGCDLLIANANGRQVAERCGIPLFRAGFPVFDRLGAAHQVSVGYRGTRDLIFRLGNLLIEHPRHGHRRAQGEDHHAGKTVALG
jgi:nitrogenase molybdenum-iron protein NifN